MEFPRTSTLLSISDINNSSFSSINDFNNWSFLSINETTESKVNDLEIEIEIPEPKLIKKTEIKVYNVFEINQKNDIIPNFTFNIFKKKDRDNDSPSPVDQKSINIIKDLPSKLISLNFLNPISCFKNWNHQDSLEYGLRPFSEFLLKINNFNFF
jgi:hypothetical protein